MCKTSKFQEKHVLRACPPRRTPAVCESMSAGFLAAVAARATDVQLANGVPHDADVLPIDLLAAVCLHLHLRSLGRVRLLSHSWSAGAVRAMENIRSLLGQDCLQQCLNDTPHRWRLMELDSREMHEKLAVIAAQATSVSSQSRCKNLDAFATRAPREAATWHDPLAVASHLGWPLLVPLRHYRVCHDGSLESECRRRCTPVPSGIKSRWLFDVFVVRAPISRGYEWLVPRPWRVRLVGYAAAEGATTFSTLCTQLSRVFASVRAAAETDGTWAKMKRCRTGAGIVLDQVPGSAIADIFGSQMTFDLHRGCPEPHRTLHGGAFTPQPAPPDVQRAEATLLALQQAGFDQVVLTSSQGDGELSAELLGVSAFRCAALRIKNAWGTDGALCELPRVQRWAGAATT